ncbi:hypothetical protein KPL35_11185 [Clostridium sp. CF011]|uniref:hypothetical protein n=1 Tax=unclassified Clostridium TaxID=2614128 RepID=UPI001C0CC49B|nr:MULTISPECIES: hypothetical protein [unclassified Clostridium]MBU3092638.1 hypothetical protein [Clostridium sp. CF011]MBW9145320.1 hypothetical protein [Clostridium sp. CM027]UVE42459.1 hypothetical protein KTC92_08540 [Clostridium sp. CM027]WAG71478.1 hypothetical protein LL036_08775 [Clostridium sp. CF011]
MKKVPKNLIAKSQVIPDNDDKAVEELLTYMQNYTIELPGEEEIDATIEVLRQYVPIKNERFKKFCHIIRMAAGEITFISKIYWVFCTAIFIIGYFISINQIDPYITIMALAPLPSILGIVEVFKGRDSGVLEIELSCKISAIEIMLSRILVIGIYSIFMNTALSVVLYMFRSNIDLWKLSVLWLTPLTLVSGVSLWIAMKIKGDYAVAAIVSIWSMVILYMCIDKKFVNTIMQLDTVAYMVILSISTLMLVLQLKALQSRYNNIFERGNQIEISA